MKKIFITGGTSGIGLSLAENFLNRGWIVGVCGRDTSKIPRSLSQNQNLHSYTVDVLDLDQMKKVVSEFTIRNNGSRCYGRKRRDKRWR